MVERLSRKLHTGAQPVASDRVEIDLGALAGPAAITLDSRLAALEVRVVNAETQPHALQYDLGIATHKGGRKRNEDSAIIMVAHHSAEHSLLPIVLAAVADGMGGYVSGDKASAITIQVVVDYLIDNLLCPPTGLQQPLFNPLDVTDRLVEAVTQANLTLMSMLPESGSTLTCVLVIGGTAYIAHVGDSRAYIMGENGLERLTRDHLVVRYMQETGVLTEQEAADHPEKHILYRALGMTEDGFYVDVTSRRLGERGSIFLCTDGVWSSLTDDEILARLHADEPAQVICEAVINDALRSSASDNVTAVLVRDFGV